LEAVNEIALQQQRTVDRIALAGTLLAMLSAAAFIALDPVQTVVRRAPARLEPVAPGRDAALVAPVPERSPLRRLELPSPTWTVVTDGSWAAYSRVARGEPAEIVVRSLRDESWKVAHRAGPAAYFGQLSLAGGVLAFEEIALSSADAVPGEVTVQMLNVTSGARTTVDSYARLAPGSASPVTDGSRVFWVRHTLLPGGLVGQDLYQLDLASGDRRMLFRQMAQVSGLTLGYETLAFTTLANERSESYVVDLASGALRRIEGFAFSYVQSVGPEGVVLSGSPTPATPAASWLVRADGSRQRLAADCFNVQMTLRLLALRCGAQVEIRDLRSGTSLYLFAGDAGALAVYESGVVWGEGDALVVYDLPALETVQLHGAE
jgi:hypothetical protein